MNDSSFEKRREQKEERKRFVKQANAKIIRMRSARDSKFVLPPGEKLGNTFTCVPMRPIWGTLIFVLGYVLFLEISNRKASVIEQNVLGLSMILALFSSGVLMIIRREMPGKFGIIRSQEAVVWGWILAVFCGILLVACILSLVFGW